jgi:hypothetical protein
MILYIGDEFEKLTEQERMQQCIEKLRKSKMCLSTGLSIYALNYENRQ